jgi:hypothetical protein
MSLMLEHGKYPSVSLAVSAWAWAKAYVGNYSDAWRFARLALGFANEGRDPVSDARAKIYIYYYVHHWRKPWQDAIAPLADVFRECRMFGALDLVQMDGGMLLRLAFICGEPLDQLAIDSNNYLEMLTDFKQSSYWNMNVPLFQAILNLLGKSEDPTVLTGEYMDQEERVAAWKQTGNKAAMNQYQLFVMILAAFFGDDKLAVAIESKMLPLGYYRPDFCYPYRVFITGLVYFGREKKKPCCGFRKRGRSLLHKLEEWTREGAVSCAHMYQLLMAENMSCSSTKTDTVIFAYNEAIKAAEKAKMVHHEALANERAAMYLLSLNKADRNPKQTTLCSTYLSQAVTLYNRWGAKAKVESMKLKYGDHLSFSFVELSGLNRSRRKIQPS